MTAKNVPQANVLTELVLPGRLGYRILSGPQGADEHPSLRGLAALTASAAQTLALPITVPLYGVARLARAYKR